MKKKNKKKCVRNCKDGLTSKQEHLARQIRQDLLDDLKKKKHYEEIINLWENFCSEISCEQDDFVSYVNKKMPELYSAFKRLNIDIMEIVTKR